MAAKNCVCILQEHVVNHGVPVPILLDTADDNTEESHTDSIDDDAVHVVAHPHSFGQSNDDNSPSPSPPLLLDLFLHPYVISL